MPVHKFVITFLGIQELVQTKSKIKSMSRTLPCEEHITGLIFFFLFPFWGVWWKWVFSFFVSLTHTNLQGYVELTQNL